MAETAGSKKKPKKAAAKKKAPKKAASKKPAAKKSKAKAKKKGAAAKAGSQARKAASKAGKRAGTAVKRARSESTQRGSQLAVSVLDLQKTSFDNAVKAIESLQKSSEKVFKELVDNSSMMPREGKKVIDEWRRMLKRSQSDFTKTVDKSFDLWTAFFERLRREEASAAKEAKAEKKSAAAPKKTKVKRKPKKAKPKKAAAKSGGPKKSGATGMTSTS